MVLLHRRPCTVPSTPVKWRKDPHRRTIFRPNKCSGLSCSPQWCRTCKFSSNSWHKIRLCKRCSANRTPHNQTRVKAVAAAAAAARMLSTNPVSRIVCHHHHSPNKIAIASHHSKTTIRTFHPRRRHQCRHRSNFTIRLVPGHSSTHTVVRKQCALANGVGRHRKTAPRST